MIELSGELDETHLDALEDRLCEYVRCQWTVVNDRPGTPFYLKGYFETEAEADSAWAALQADAGDYLPATVSRRQLDDADWQDAYKRYLKPWHCGHLHWVPEWMRADFKPPQGAVVLYFDAGMAFGTGAHETTRLMARRLMAFRDTHPDSARIIDAGCGSGILALSAYKLGFRDVFGFDRDTESIRISRENRASNGLPDDVVDFAACGLEAGLQGRQAELILANIISEVLVIHADVLLSALAPRGVLALSGILAKEANAVREVFAQKADALFPEGLSIDQEVDGDWSDLQLTRH